MKPFLLRFFLVLGAVLWAGLSLTGCAKARDQTRAKQLMERFSQHFESEFTCAMDGLELGGKISRPNPGSGVIEMTAPKNLAGLTYRLDSDQVEVSFSGLSFTLDKSAGGVAGLAPLPQALTALSALLTFRPEELPVREGEVWKMSATVNGKECSMLIAEDTGLPVKLLLEGGDLEIELKNFTFLG